MPHVELSRPLEDYFAFAETERRGDARRFTITLPYLAGAQLGRLQWWWRMSDAEFELTGEEGMAARRARETDRFRRHIVRWLANTGQRLYGDEPIPRIAALPAPDPRTSGDQTARSALPRSVKVANG